MIAIIKTLQVILALSVLILVHELGHFLFAKLFGIRIDKFFPSSQVCHCCGHKNSETKDLSVREWTCPQCGAVHDRDVNAAINILNEGLQMTGV